MIFANIQVNGICANAVSKKLVPAGLIGGQVAFEFKDSRWDGLTKTVVFKGFGTKDVLLAGETAIIPAEVVQRSRVRLLVGIYGTDAQNTIAIPTLWADLGEIRDATDPSGDPDTDPQLPIWAQLQADITALKEQGVSDEQLAKVLNTYFEENPIDVPVQSVNGKTGSVKLTAADVGAIAEEDLQQATNEALVKAKESGAFDGPQGPQGVPGDDYVLTDEDKTEIAEQAAGLVEVPESGGIAVTGATVGQTVKIAAVDENGVPTAWLPTEFPSGGGEEFEEIANVTLAEDVNYCSITEDLNGQPFQLKKAIILMRIRGNTSGTTGWINLILEDGTTGVRCTSLPSGFAATEGQDNYRTTRLQCECTELETVLFGLLSANSTSSKNNLGTYNGSDSSYAKMVTPIKYISKFNFWCNGASLGANTEIFIYGVRA